MLQNIVQKLTRLSDSRGYWLAYIIGGLFLLSVALFYQYYMEELPCVMCIQVRLWVLLFIIVACLGMFSIKHKIINTASHVLTIIASIGLVERSYQVLGTERGFVFGDCGFSLGMPTWFAVDKWLPWLFQVETSCGYTPGILFGITMAEALMIISICLLLLSVSVFITYLFNRGNAR